MTDRSDRLESPCPSKGCNNVITVEQNWIAGGKNDYGGFILKCIACGTIFDMWVGRDVDASRVLGGATLLAKYHRDVPGDREATRTKHGLPPSENSN
jgi:hypothetical protein